MCDEQASPDIIDFLVPGALEPDCRRCPRGAGLSLTVHFLGLGTRSMGDRVTYSPEENMFPKSVAEALADRPHDCCRDEMLVVKHDPRGTLKTNAAAVAARIESRLDTAAGEDWVQGINLHLVGFSAGGLLALETARQVDASTRHHPPGTTWCDREQEPEIPVETDLVTMATPFNLDWWLAGVISTGWPWTYESSVGASDYGAPPAAKLCSFTAFVSSKQHGDDSPGADRLPGADPHLEDLLDGLPAAAKKIETLKDEWTPDDPEDEDDPEHVSHVEVPAKVLEEFPWALLARCECVRPS